MSKSISRLSLLLPLLLSAATVDAAPDSKPAIPAGDARTTAAPGAAERDTKARDYFTDTKLIDQHGRERRFFSDVLHGKTVVINFVYTNCGDACPLITHKLAAVKQKSGELFGKDLRFVSISIDPERDTPESLRKFAKKFDADHPEWVFLTGPKESVMAVVKKLGAWTGNVESHSTMLLAGNVAAARWRKLKPELPPEVLAETLQLIARNDLPAYPSRLDLPPPGSEKR